MVGAEEAIRKLVPVPTLLGDEADLARSAKAAYHAALERALERVAKEPRGVPVGIHLRVLGVSCTADERWCQVALEASNPTREPFGLLFQAEPSRPSRFLAPADLYWRDDFAPEVILSDRAGRFHELEARILPAGRRVQWYASFEARYGTPAAIGLRARRTTGAPDEYLVLRVVEKRLKRRR